MLDRKISSSKSSGRSAGGVPTGGTPSRLGRPPAKARGRRGVTERNRPLWLLIPGGVLMVTIIVVPILIALYMSVLNLDQYTLRQWLNAPFIGVGNYVEALTQSPLLMSFWISISFAVISTAVTIPLGVGAAIATQNRFRGRASLRGGPAPGIRRTG